MEERRIVVVDDDLDYLELMSDLLPLEGFVPILVDRCADAFELVRAQQPHVVILDMRMERDESGLELLQKLRQDLHTAHIPVLVCSAELDVSLKVQRVCSEGYDTLRKPFRISVLVTKLTDLLAQTTYR